MDQNQSSPENDIILENLFNMLSPTEEEEPTEGNTSVAGNTHILQQNINTHTVVSRSAIPTSDSSLTSTKCTHIGPWKLTTGFNKCTAPCITLYSVKSADNWAHRTQDPAVWKVHQKRTHVHQERGRDTDRS